MFDPENKLYRWRTLFPALQLNANETIGLEERKGIELFREGSVQIQDDTITAEDRQLQAYIGSYSMLIRRDIDGRIHYAECDCGHFRKHKLRHGPCRHIVALSLAGGL